MTSKERVQREAIRKLRAILKPGNTVYTILRHVSKSGMSRRISLVTFKNNQPYFLDYWASKALDWRLHHDKEGIVTTGCGMDMGFHLVYTLSRVIFKGARKDPGYKLNHRWL